MGLYVEQPHCSALQRIQALRHNQSAYRIPRSNVPIRMPPTTLPVFPAHSVNSFYSSPLARYSQRLRQVSFTRSPHPPRIPDCKRPRKEGNQECPPTRPGGPEQTEKAHIVTLSPIHWAPLPTRLHRQAPGPGILAPIPRCSIFCMRMTSRSMTLHGARLSGVYSASSGHENTQNGPLFIIREYSPMTAPFRNPIPVLCFLTKKGHFILTMFTIRRNNAPNPPLFTNHSHWYRRADRTSLKPYNKVQTCGSHVSKYYAITL